MGDAEANSPMESIKSVEEQVEQKAAESPAVQSPSSENAVQSSEPVVSTEKVVEPTEECKPIQSSEEEEKETVIVDVAKEETKQEEANKLRNYSKEEMHIKMGELKALFEQVTKTKCISYFDVTSVSDNASRNRTPSVAVRHGKSTGYAGGDHETNLFGMKEKQYVERSRDPDFVKLLDTVGQNCGRSSDLNFILAFFLRECNFSEIVENRLALFKSLLRVIEDLSDSDEETKSNLTPGQSVGNIVEALRKKREDAVVYIKCFPSIEEVEQQNLKTAAESLLETIENIISVFDEAEAAREDEEKESDETQDAAETKSSGFLSKVGKMFKKKPKPVKEMTPEEIEIKQWLYSRKLMFCDVMSHSYFNPKTSGYHNGNEERMTKEKLVRLKKEISILQSSLPDGIFVRVDETRFDIMQVMIIGPQGTPYENGCFLFDLYLPSDFPYGCPQMKFMTTGRGQFRFNPNLYADGKVCLSLLGTWSGPAWNSETSTILQLLVSIWSMIFVDYPLENEPGYEGKARKPMSLNYNAGIRCATMKYAMEWHLNNKTFNSCFVNEVKAHLYLVRDYLINEQLNSWISLNRFRRNSSYFNSRYLKAGDIGDIGKRVAKLIENKPEIEIS